MLDEPHLHPPLDLNEHILLKVLFLSFIYGSTFPWRKIRGAVSVLLHVVSELMKSWAKQDLAHPLRPVILLADVSDTVLLYVYVCLCVFSFMLRG